MIEITEEEWEATYKPVRNVFDESAVFHGTMYETYGAEFDFIIHAPKNNVWTWIVGDGASHIVAGFHFVNRLGYFITEVPWTNDVVVTIK